MIETSVMKELRGFSASFPFRSFDETLTIFNNNMIPKTEPCPGPPYRYISHIYTISWIDGPHVL